MSGSQSGNHENMSRERRVQRNQNTIRLLSCIRNVSRLCENRKMLCKRISGYSNVISHSLSLSLLFLHARFSYEASCVKRQASSRAASVAATFTLMTAMIIPLIRGAPAEDKVTATEKRLPIKFPFPVEDDPTITISQNRDPLSIPISPVGDVPVTRLTRRCVTV